MFEENQTLWGAETRTMARHKQQLTQSLAADLDREPDDVGCRRPLHARGVRRLTRSMTTPTV
jgi:hypothetical protein